MADQSDSSSESDESYIGEVQAADEGLRAYQFEPRRTDQAYSPQRREGTEVTEGEAIERNNRMEGNVEEWCSCGNCSVDLVVSDKECLCCMERPATRRKASPNTADENQCVTNNLEYQALCLNPVVLRNVLVGLNNVRMDNFEVDPPNNICLRYAAYRQFTWWAHGKLGPGRGRVVPACASHRIRQAFMKNPEEQFTGYTSGNESDS